MRWEFWSEAGWCRWSVRRIIRIMDIRIWWSRAFMREDRSGWSDKRCRVGNLTRDSLRTVYERSAVSACKKRAEDVSENRLSASANENWQGSIPKAAWIWQNVSLLYGWIECRSFNSRRFNLLAVHVTKGNRPLYCQKKYGFPSDLSKLKEKYWRILYFNRDSIWWDSSWCCKGQQKCRYKCRYKRRSKLNREKIISIKKGVTKRTIEPP